MASTLLYIVDDQTEQLSLMERYCQKLGYEYRLFTAAKACLHAIKTQTPDAIITDLFMPEMDGTTFVKACQKNYSHIPIMVLTVSDSTTDAVKAMRYGAWDFVTKPIGFERFEVSTKNMLQRRTLKEEIETIIRQSQNKASFDDIIGQSPPMRHLFETIQKVAPTQTPVLIEGASGVGKELVAKAIHHGSERASGPFIAVNCGAIPENLVESTLFGHEKGAFTGATTPKEGKFQAAEGGTLFLDEIGDLPLDAQVKLLRVLQEGEAEAVGARQAKKVNVRLLCATNKNLCAMVQTGAFREDLFYRVHIYPVNVPDLNQRGDDVLLLAEHFVKNHARSAGLPAPKIGKGAASFLKSYPWPGNVRQLENAITRVVVNIGGKREISAEDFAWLTPAPDGAREQNGKSHIAEIVPLAEMEARYIRQVVDLCGGNLTQAAQRLEIARGTLYRKLEA